MSRRSLPSARWPRALQLKMLAACSTCVRRRGKAHQTGALAAAQYQAEEAFEIEPEFNSMRAKDPNIDKLLTIATRLEGMARNAGVHAAGVVISSTPLRELVPLYKTNRDEVVTQFDMVGLEKLNLLKMDFLGLTTLTIIHEAVALIEKHRARRSWSTIFRSTTQRRTRSSRKPSPAACSSSNRPA
jgi:DNA polymerase III alpha subunit